MLCRGHIVQVQAPNGSYDIAAFFIEREHAKNWGEQYCLGAGLVHGDTTPVFRVIPGFRIDFEGVAHLHQLQ